MIRGSFKPIYTQLVNSRPNKETMENKIRINSQKANTKTSFFETEEYRLREKISELQNKCIHVYEDHGNKCYELANEIIELKNDFKALVKNYDPKRAKEKIAKVEAIQKTIKAKSSQIKREWTLYKKELRSKQKAS